MKQTSLKTKSKKKENTKSSLEVNKQPLNENHKQTIIDFNVLKNTGIDSTKIKAKVKNYFQPQKSFLIHMELANGKHKQMIVFLNDDYFEWNGKTYIVDEKFKYEDISANKWCLDYHENLSIPIQRRLDIIQIQDNLFKLGATHEAINPRNLARFIKSKVIEMLMQGGAMENLFKFLKLVGIISAVSSTAVLLITLNNMGVFSQLGI